MNKRFIFIITFVLFFLSRLYVLKNPPPYYSDVFHDYRRYAQMWESGLTPYLKHLYEYTPATIPLLYFPQILDHFRIGHYYENYRFQIFILDTLIFFFIYQTIIKLKTKPISKFLALSFYLISSMIAKDFFYEGIDLVFIGSLALAIIFSNHRLKFWFFFWLSTGIKLMSAPLVLIFLFIKKISLKKEIKNCLIGFALVWGLPLVIFRSSLSVILYLLAHRGIKYAAFPSFVVETINYWTQTETRLQQPPDFQLQGPISVMAEKVVAIVFPLSILVVLAYGLYMVLKKRSQLNPYTFGLKISLIYILTIFLTGKIFSQPFHIWLLPLIALYPFKSIKKQLIFIFLTFWLLIIDTTPWIRVNETLMVYPPLPMKFFIYSLRFIPMFTLLGLSSKLENK